MPRQRRRAVGVRQRAWLILGAAAVLAACGEDSDPVATAEGPASAPTPQLTSASDWRRLGDGSFVRTATDAIASRRETDRCWPIEGGFDCLSLDAIAYPPSAIVVATRTSPRSYGEVPVAPPEVGFSCAIYPSGVIEQRLIRGEAPRRQNDDTDGRLWSAAEVARLSPAVAGRAGDFVDCKALAARLSGNSTGTLEGAGFERRDVMPTAS